MEYFNEYQFIERVNAALAKVKTVLEVNRNPTFAADVSHRYEDKYLLAEWLVNSSLASLEGILKFMGVPPEGMKKVKEAVKSRSVTLRFSSEERCSFVREATRHEDSKTQHVTTFTSAFGSQSKMSSKTVTKITEYFWKFTAEWKLFLFVGNDPKDAVLLQTRKGEVELVTSTKDTPKPDVKVFPEVDVNITWALTMLSSDGTGTFSIDRQKEKCHTPRRNDDVQGALDAFWRLSTWTQKVNAYFRQTLFPVQPQKDHKVDLSQIEAGPLPLIPVLPLFEKATGEGEGEGAASVLMTRNDFDLFMAEFKRGVDAKCADIDKALPHPETAAAEAKKLISVQEGKLLYLLMLIRSLSTAIGDGLNYIENMIRKQVIAAIGKEVGVSDMAEYMRFHNRKLFSPSFAPRPFCYDVRRGDGDYGPEGLLSLESLQSSAETGDPVTTVRLIRDASTAHTMRFPLSAATNVSFRGPHLIHGYINQQFSGERGATHRLVARARQFSSFVLMVGKIAAADVFEPKHALIVKDRDEAILPLVLNPLPTAKEFKDAISSLSPEQQRFAKAFRQMQLESTLFGVLVVQIKPQLERLLHLPPGALTKEVQLNQNLMELFLDFQIPSDLVTFSGDPNASLNEKLEAVKGHVGEMFKIINAQKQKQIDDQKMAAQNAVLSRIEDGKNRHSRRGKGWRGGSSSLESADLEEDEICMERCEDASMSLSLCADGAMPQMAYMAPPVGAMASKSAAPPMQMRARNAAPVPSSTPVPSPPVATSRKQHGGLQPAQQEQGQGKSTPQEGQQPEAGEEGAAAGGAAGAGGHGGVPSRVIDYTRVPARMDKKFEVLDIDAALRPTTISVGEVWTRTSQAGLLGKPETKSLEAEEQRKERSRAMDLLDALTLSGALQLEGASLHVVVAATHCFDETLMDSLVKKNVNPIEKIERSTLIVASTIYDLPVPALIAEPQKERIQTYSPMLMDGQ